MIGQFQRLIKIMGDENYGLFQLNLQLQKQILHVGADEWIERGECFIHEHDIRV